MLCPCCSRRRSPIRRNAILSINTRNGVSLSINTALYKWPFYYCYSTKSLWLTVTQPLSRPLIFRRDPCATFCRTHIFSSWHEVPLNAIQHVNSSQYKGAWRVTGDHFARPHRSIPRLNVRPMVTRDFCTAKGLNSWKAIVLRSAVATSRKAIVVHYNCTINNRLHQPSPFHI